MFLRKDFCAANPRSTLRIYQTPTREKKIVIHVRYLQQGAFFG